MQGPSKRGMVHVFTVVVVKLATTSDTRVQISSHSHYYLMNAGVKKPLVKHPTAWALTRLPNAKLSLACDQANPVKARGTFLWFVSRSLARRCSESGVTIVAMHACFPIFCYPHMHPPMVAGMRVLHPIRRSSFYAADSKEPIASSPSRSHSFRAIADSHRRIHHELVIASRLS